MADCSALFLLLNFSFRQETVLQKIKATCLFYLLSSHSYWVFPLGFFWQFIFRYRKHLVQNLDSLVYKKYFNDFYVRKKKKYFYLQLHCRCVKWHKSVLSLTSELYNHNQNKMKVKIKNYIYIKIQWQEMFILTMCNLSGGLKEQEM